MKPVHVAMLLHSYYPIVGGAERQLQALLPHLRERGVHATVLTRRYPGLPAFEIVDETPVYRLPAPGLKPVAALSYITSSILRLLRIRPDVIHTYDLQSPTSAAILASGLLHTPVVAKVLSGGSKGDIDRIRHSRGGEMRLHALARLVNKFIVISEEIAAELDAIGGVRTKYAFIPNGVDLERYSPALPEQKKKMRASLDLPLESRIGIFVARLIPEKRPQHLLDIWASVRAQFPDTLLMLIGSGPEAENLQAMQVEGVRFTGQVENVQSYFQAADFFVLPSAREGLSNALLEAQASGIPVIATSIGAAPELIEDGISGLLVDVDDVKALREAVLRLLGDEELRTRLSVNGRKRVLAQYSLQSTADQLVDLYRELLGN
jgi:glycosyltransferase involved in cell wall biosynthesis